MPACPHIVGYRRQCGVIEVVTARAVERRRREDFVGNSRPLRTLFLWEDIVSVGYAIAHPRLNPVGLRLPVHVLSGRQLRAPGSAEWYVKDCEKTPHKKTSVEDVTPSPRGEAISPG